MNHAQSESPGIHPAPIHFIRGKKVMLSRDLARLCGVRSGTLSQLVRRNCERFPEEMAFQLTREEFKSSMAQFVTSKSRQGRRGKPPWVFTEHGVAMLAILTRSQKIFQINRNIDWKTGALRRR
jgi:hypothetical protein